MEININLLEAASEQADKIVFAKFEEYDSASYESSTDTITNYSEEAQDLFNEWYDYYYDFLLRLKTN